MRSKTAKYPAKAPPNLISRPLKRAPSTEPVEGSARNRRYAGITGKIIMNVRVLRGIIWRRSCHDRLRLSISAKEEDVIRSREHANFLTISLIGGRFRPKRVVDGFHRRRSG